MIKVICMVVSALAVTVLSFPASACDSPKDIPSPRIEELMEVMKDSGSTELKQLLALEELSCSNLPALRKFAVDFGMASKSKTLRAQAFAILMLARDQIRVDILEEIKGDQTLENFFRSFGHSVAYPLYERDAEKNCISIWRGMKCPSDLMIAIDGLNVRLTDSNKRLTGTFVLQPDGSLRGTVLVAGQSRPVAAKIELEK